jgi:hypothetical protein
MCHESFDQEYKYCDRIHDPEVVGDVTELLDRNNHQSWVSRGFGVFRTLEYRDGGEIISEIASCLTGGGGVVCTAI